MAIEETGLYIGDFSTTASANKPTSNPGKRTDGAGEIRQLKKILFDTLPEADGPINVSDTEFNHLAGVTSAIQTQFDTIEAGLGTAAAEDVGTSSGDVVQLGASGLPAVSGTLLTNLPGINQVQTDTDSTESTDSSGAVVDTALSVTITPESSTSKLLLIAYTYGYVLSNASAPAAVSADYMIREGSSVLSQGGMNSVFEYTGTNRVAVPCTLFAIVSSTGTSARTFKMSMQAGASDTVYFSFDNTPSYLMVAEIGG